MQQKKNQKQNFQLLFGIFLRRTTAWNGTDAICYISDCSYRMKQILRNTFFLMESTDIERTIFSICCRQSELDILCI